MVLFGEEGMMTTQTRLGRNGDSCRVFLIDAHSILRDGLRRLLEAERQYQICGEAKNGRSALTSIARARPHLVIMEIALPEAHGLGVIKSLRSRFPGLLMLVLSMHDEALYAERALQAGAKGYIMKQEPWERLLLAIQKVLRQEISVSETISTRVLRGMASRRVASHPHLQALSDRELEIVDSMGQGLATGEIAGRLGISAKTVETHRGNIRRKLGLRSGPELMRFALASRANG
jgi:DNA-binding NarL/FixJ family response regulator